MGLAVSSERRDGATVVRLVGDFDLHTSAEVRSTVSGLVDSDDADTGDLYLDMSEVDFLDSSGLGTLVGLQKRANRARVKMALCALSPQLQKIFDVTHLQEAFTILPEVPAGE